MSRFRGRWSDVWPYFGFALLGIGLAVWQGVVYHDKTTGADGPGHRRGTVGPIPSRAGS